MALHVIKGLSLEKLTEVAQAQAKGDRSKIENINRVNTLVNEEQHSTDRIPDDQACLLLEQWKQALLRLEQEVLASNGDSSSRQTLFRERQEKLKDELYVESGYDVATIWDAWEAYGLKTEITQEDRVRYNEIYHLHA